MAQTDSRAGFRLPWSSERSTDSTDTQPSDADAATESDMDDVHAEARADADGASTENALTGLGWAPTPVADATPVGHADPASGGTGRKPSKFLADLTRAMQAAAEEARGLTLSQFQADAKLHVEKIHERSATEAAGLRRAADDDVAAVREWSKTEIARIREETETRITARKGRLESEIEEHASLIEREIEAVQRRVAAFEQEMAEFFERLLAEDDPTRFATMAERLPEPPPFEAITADSWEPQPAAEPEAEVVAEEGAAGEASAAADHGDAAVGRDEWGDGTTATDGDASSGIEVPAAPDDFEVDREAAFAAIQAAAEAAASAEVAADAADRAEAVADIAIEIVGSHDEGDSESHGHTDFDAAEAEAAATADATGEVEEVPVIGDDALAARLADILPGQAEKDGAQETKTTQVVVVGLVSVASIASFKRHLGRLNGVQSVGVSSGPDGEFVFAVHHGPDVVLRDAIPSMPSFQARVTGSGDGTLNVTAHDPESDN